MKLIRKFLLPVLLILAFIFTMSSLRTFLRERDRLRTTELENAQQLALVFQSQLDAREAFAVGLALDTANNPAVQAAFAAQDRETLTALTLPAYTELDNRFNIPQHQFHLPPATSFLRLHQPDRFGDDLSAFRLTVLDANVRQTAVSGLEIGRAGLGIRGVAPISYEDRHVGTVEFGLNVDELLLRELESQYNTDWQLLLRQEPTEVAIFSAPDAAAIGPTDNLILQASTRDEPLFAGPNIYTRVLSGESLLTRQTDTAVAFYSTPLRDFSGEIIGVVEIIQDRSPIITAMRREALIVSLLGLISLVFTGAILTLVVRRTMSPIDQLSNAARAIAAGDLNTSISVESDDELGQLANTFNDMTAQLREAIATLEESVADRTKALATSTEVSRSLSTILDPDQLVNEVVNQIQAAFGYYHAHIYLASRPGGHLIMAGGTGQAGRTMLARGHALDWGQGLVGQAAATNEVVLISDVTREPNWLPNELLPQTRAEIAVPIALGTEVLGVLDVQANRVDGLGEQDAYLLEAIAAQIAVALRNARLFDTARSQAENQTVINRINQRINAANDVESVLAIAAEELGAHLDVAQTAVTLHHTPPTNGNNTTPEAEEAEHHA